MILVQLQVLVTTDSAQFSQRGRFLWALSHAKCQKYMWSFWILSQKKNIHNLKKEGSVQF